MILLDTHVWLWWLSEPSRLSGTATRRIEEAKGASDVGVSAISAWEAAMLVRQGRLELRLPVTELVTACTRLPFLHFVPIDPGIAGVSVELEGLHADPADRLIVATAKRDGRTLITRDERLRTWDGVATHW